MCNTRCTQRLGITLSVGLILLLCPPGRVQDPKAAGQHEGAEKSTAARKGTAGFSPLDFQALANQKRKDSFHSGDRPANTLASLAPGEHRLLGIPFQIGEGVLQVGSTQLANKPAKITGIKVEKKLRELYFLHATAYHLDEEVPIGSYTVRYADGTSETVPIVNSQDVTDWWKYPFSKAPTKGKVAWEGANDAAKEFNATLWLFMSAWKNPRPHSVVKSVDLASTMDTACAPFCVAITMSQPLRARARVKPLTPAELDRLWTELAGEGATAYDAVETLAGAPAQAIPFLSARIRPAGPAVDAKAIAALIVKLDNDSLDEREAASKELQKLGIEALPQIGKAATESKSAEVRQRARSILEQLKTANLTPDQRRLQAVLDVLELIASADAQRLLEDVAGGKAGAWLTAKAKDSLKRLGAERD
jgi:hypothetical protein